MKFMEDMEKEKDEGEIDSEELMSDFREYMEENNMEEDWESIEREGNEKMVNEFYIMQNLGNEEKKEMLEEKEMKKREEKMIEIKEMVMEKVKEDDFGQRMKQSILEKKVRRE